MDKTRHEPVIAPFPVKIFKFLLEFFLATTEIYSFLPLRKIARNYAETVCFHKMFTPGS